MRLLTVFAGLCAVIELGLSLADWGLWGGADTRYQVFRFCALQPAMFETGAPGFFGQTFSMFLTYSLLHTDLLHLVGNIAILLWVGLSVTQQRDPWDVALLCVFSTIGAALAFVLLADPFAMVVGASGLACGLLGAWCVTPGPSEQALARGPLIRLGALILAILVFDVLSRLLLGQISAWQAHLGGILSGAFYAWIWPARQEPEQP